MKLFGSCTTLLVLVGLERGADANRQPAEAIASLKSQLADQQQKVASLQSEVASLIRDVSAEKGHTSGVSGGGISLDINFPGETMPEAGIATGAAPASPDLSLESTAPIPVMILKPSSVADAEDALTQVLEQEAAFSGQSQADNEIPMSQNIQSPEDIIDQAVARIDQLESEKTHYKYDSENVRKNYVA